jgi:hypothetical protein
MLLIRRSYKGSFLGTDHSDLIPATRLTAWQAMKPKTSGGDPKVAPLTNLAGRADDVSSHTDLTAPSRNCYFWRGEGVPSC